jgi:hypothetical protein
VSDAKLRWTINNTMVKTSKTMAGATETVFFAAVTKVSDVETGRRFLWLYDFDGSNPLRFLDKTFVKRSKACGF